MKRRSRKGLLRRFWHWLRKPHWRETHHQELIGYDRPNPFGYQAPIYRTTGRVVWRNSGSKLTWLILGLFWLMFFVSLPLPVLWEEWTKQIIAAILRVPCLDWLCLSKFVLLSTFLDLLLIVLFFISCLCDGYGEERWYPPREDSA